MAALFSAARPVFGPKPSNFNPAGRHYAVKEGDHLTFLNVHNAFEASHRSSQWSQARPPPSCKVTSMPEADVDFVVLRGLGVPSILPVEPDTHINPAPNRFEI